MHGLVLRTQDLHSILLLGDVRVLAKAALLGHLDGGHCGRCVRRRGAGLALHLALDDDQRVVDEGRRRRTAVIGTEGVAGGAAYRPLHNEVEEAGDGRQRG